MTGDWLPPGSPAVTGAARERVKGAKDWRHHGEGPFVTHRRDAPPDAMWRDGDLVFAVTNSRETLAQRRARRLDIGLNLALVLI